MRKVAVAVVGLIECGALGYVVLVTWLLTVLFVDDSVAARMTNADWYLAAATRAFVATVVAAIAGFIIYVLNRFVARQAGHAESKVPRVSGLAFAFIVFVAGLAGSLEFAIKKPFM